MKLRIRGNTLRLRVSKSEVDGLAAGRAVEDSTRFGADAVLRYRLESGGEDFEARFDGGAVRVRVPQSALDRWLDDAEVSMSAEQPLGGGETLAILVEKDFECLTPREGEDSSDLFANPSKQAPYGKS